MFSKSKIRLDPDLHRRAAAKAKELGYSSLDEFIAHLLERELKQTAEQAAKEKVLQKMKGLGYL